MRYFLGSGLFSRLRDIPLSAVSRFRRVGRLARCWLTYGFGRPEGGGMFLQEADLEGGEAVEEICRFMMEINLITSLKKRNTHLFSLNFFSLSF